MGRVQHRNNQDQSSTEHTDNKSSISSSTIDLGSVLAKFQSLEKEKADMCAQFDVTSAKLSKLQESKRTEMEQMMNSYHLQVARQPRHFG